MPKYYLYTRKSTDEEDRQVLSLESQLNELHEYAKREGLEIADEFIEAKTAKKPGRTIFNLMIKQIESNGISGILAWHPDRLARNSMDGGKIIYLVDTGKLVDLRFPTYRFDNSAQGKFMLSIAFGQSKYYIDNLSENVKRGFRQKIRRGEYPGFAPLGYTNDIKNHSIAIDPDKAPFIKKIFELYAASDYSLDELKKVTDRLGLIGKRGKPVRKSELARILKNPFYYGMMLVKGELHEASHPPLISQKLFASVQEVLENRGKPMKKGIIKFTFIGLMKCKSCGASITAETQKGHVYYHCTKKLGLCESKKFLREEDLLSQIDKVISKISIDDETKNKMLDRFEALAHEESKSSLSLSRQVQEKIAELDKKMERLIDLFVEQEISEEDYKIKKVKILNDKQLLKEKLGEIEKGSGGWLEPSKNFLSTCNQASYVAWQETPVAKRAILKIIGSNFLLFDRTLFISYSYPYSLVTETDPAENWGG